MTGFNKFRWKYSYTVANLKLTKLLSSLRLGLLLKTANNMLFIVELTVGSQVNLIINAERKRPKYANL